MPRPLSQPFYRPSSTGRETCADRCHEPATIEVAIPAGDRMIRLGFCDTHALERTAERGVITVGDIGW